MKRRIDPEANGIPRRRLTVGLAALALALGGAGVAGCDDDDEGPAEEAGQAVDDAGQEAGEAIEDADQEVGEDED